jgi:NAD(P)-dependent dehydrogenase (short-subunit alcohol dehydrogenase family)
MDLGLSDKVAVVTGGSHGIGLATVRQFLQEGCKVAFCARSEDRLKSAARELAGEFGEESVFAQVASVLEPDTMTGFAQEVAAHCGPADILVNNAGQGRVSTFRDTSDQDWRDELELKFFSQIYPLRAFEDQLKSTGNGAIVGVNSLLAYQPEPHMVCTSAARAGVQNLLKSLANELAPAIRVNSILLGVVVSGQWEQRFQSREDQSRSRKDWYHDQAAMRNIPLGRFGEPEEPARAIVFLASPAASYITGARLEISGGTSRFV